MLNIPLALVCSAVPWLTRPVKSWLLAIGLAVGLALVVSAIVFALAVYPWTDLVVLLVALTGGVLLGRGMPPRFRPFLIVLLVLSVLDVVQIALTASSTPPGSLGGPAPRGSDPLLLGNFLLSLPWGRYNIGGGDLLLITALAEHWRRRGASYLIALLPGVLGFLLTYAFIWAGNLPLIPFITVGWVGSEGVHRVLSRHAKPRTEEPPQ
jgi:hypothetical protein